ncbi:hypothetical protein [Anaerorhabdus sp.]|uniref:hypothetical protein n=1 Tax=Anaerorhabdus sp. TaxID=1872524 RepID=UPI002FCA8908
MTNEQLNRVYIVALNKNNELFYYKQSEYLTALLENGCREPKLIKVLSNEAEAIGFLEMAAAAVSYPGDANYDAYRMNALYGGKKYATL